MLSSIYTFCFGRRSAYLFIAVALFITFNGVSSGAQAASKSLMCTPIRLIFTERQRAITAQVINQSDEAIRYSIALVTMREGNDGRLYEPEQETEEELRNKKLIRFSPRRATIGPQQSQTVKLMVRKPKDLPPGEYRTYLQLRPHPSTSQEQAEEVQRGNNLDANIEIIVNSTFSIIIQHELPMGEMRLDDMQFKGTGQRQNQPQVALTLSRKGEASAFGNIFLDYLPEDPSTDSVEVGRVIGLALYAPDTRKEVTIPLQSDIPVQQLKKGKIRVTFQPSTGKFSRRQRNDNQRIYRDFSL